jgi:plasmid maintenance system antidote protein VapI
MESGEQTLISVVNQIRNSGLRKGTTISDAEIATTTGISDKQLSAYLTGEEEPPAGLAHKMKTAFGFKSVIVRLRSTVQISEPEQPRRESVKRESKRRSLQAFTKLIQGRAKMIELLITEEDIASKIGLTAEQFQAFLNDQERTPDELPQRLLSAYQEMLDSIQLEENLASLKRSIVWIRNHGLAVGQDITIEMMAGKIGLSGEQLYALINGGDKTPVDLAYKLEVAYKELLKDLDSVELIEDIHMISRPA